MQIAYQKTLVRFLSLIFFITVSGCSNGQSRNIYTEETWEDRDKWQKPELIIEQLDLTTGENVADIGCHEGYMTVKLARHVGSSGKVFAVDIRTYRLNKLRENLRDRNINNVKVIEGDPDDPKLPKNELEAVLVLDTYHEINDHMSVLNHIRAALRPEGRLVILEPVRESLRGKSRSTQEDKHEIGMQYVRDDLEKTGFRIIKEVDPFIDRTKPKGDKLWLLIAVKE